ncbi:hypothetical protein Tco_0671859 [Tanacetum coccineum]
MSSMVELSKSYDCKVTIRSRPSTIPFIKERPQLSKSIDSNLVFDIAGHMLLFGRSEFSLVTGFACGKLVFPEYMDDGIPPFLRRVFSDKAKNLENKASLGKAAKGKAAKGKAAKGKDAKRKAAQGKATQPSDIETLTPTSRKRILLNYQRTPYTDLLGLSRQDSNPITQIRPDLKERDENWCRKMYDYVACKERSEQVDDQNGFTCDDEPEAAQDGSGTSDRASAGAKVEETKSTREVALKEELDLWKSRYVKLESYYKNLEASVEIARKNSPGLSFPTPNAKAMSVCDDIDEADTAADDNEKATSVHDDVDVPDAAADDNAKAMSVYDDIDEVDATTNDNAKATSVNDDA